MIENYDETRNAVHPEKPVMAKTGIALALAMGAMFSGCSEIGGSAGTSEEAEGIVAIANKKISGAAQKGPLVKGSEVVLRETSAEGNLEPTGREYTTVTINDKGDFKFDSLELECQYALLSAEGHYTHDVSGERSHCVLHLNAVSNLTTRNTANINLLTHFEYKRVLNLVKQGKTFAKAKKQAAKEVLNAFGVDVFEKSAEDLDIYHSSDADRTLYHISIFVDMYGFYYPMDEDDDEWYFRQDTANIDCSALQNYVDSYADDLAEDGTLSDSLIAPLAYSAYFTNLYFGNVVYEGEVGLTGRSEYDLMAERTYFYELVLNHYLGFEKCNEDRWGESRRLDKPFGTGYNDEGQLEYVNPAYFLCDGHDWKLTTKGHVDSLKMKIPHQMGKMTDSRDGRTYKTLSFELHGKKYEWMAEDLKYKGDSLYSWTQAMMIDRKYMNESVPKGLIDSVHQGICPDGWHVASTLDWDALIFYVQGVENLLDENWKAGSRFIDRGVFYNRFDFNILPGNKNDFTAYYHTYTHESFGANVQAELDSIYAEYLGENGSMLGVDWFSRYIATYRDYRTVGQTTIGISTKYGTASAEPEESAPVRCVKN